jgi:hypothetical protein
VQSVEQVARQAGDMVVNGGDADRPDPVRAHFDTRYRKKVEGTVLEGGLVVCQAVPPARGAGDLDRPTGEPEA